MAIEQVREYGAILVIAAGDAKIDNGKFKAEFGRKAKMLSPEEYSNCKRWVDVCKGWQEE